MKMVSTDLQLGRLRFQLTPTIVQDGKYIIRVRDRYVVGICIYPHYPCFKMKDFYGNDLGFRMFANDYRYVLVKKNKFNDKWNLEHYKKFYNPLQENLRSNT